MSRSNDEEIKSYFNYNIDLKAVQSALKFGQTLHFDPTSQEWVIYNSVDEIVDSLKYNAASARFGDMEFALDEEGRPDGLKNKQEMILTIAGDIADKMNDLIFEEAKRVLEREDWLDQQAMEMLKESKEK